MKTVTLRVEGMSCGHCLAAVTRALESVEGVRTANVDLGAGRAVVEYDEGATSPGELVGAVMDEGYTAEETA
ncbi:MAG: heavy-metal-associated domain-containing protein [Longimicrobiales bacterium]